MTRIHHLLRNTAGERNKVHGVHYESVSQCSHKGATEEEMQSGQNEGHEEAQEERQEQEIRWG